ncbi:mitochondrial import protein Pam17-domain-containing protein [Fusarium redolens]|uniref:Presequence translocated-associated motor subunit PAM17 n=1 Tax=Fusarium redolens TaxID=48865 RepID=A0A9P9H014_FUSRE|nr:mitochondrial import protein Pam17-domain-containing protein [Fusarium redolens]KAH7248674.1 mitochondrial import protein Pam17-domain-containing protein [Fusarium redolens]
MASSLKTSVLRMPLTGLVRSSQKASFSTLRPASCLSASPFRPQCFTPVAKTFSRTYSDKPQSTELPPLDWNSFFKLRVSRRRYQLLFSITNGLFAGGAGAVFLSTGMAEPIISQIPLDPFMTLGLMTLAFSGLGWLSGPSVGNQVFYLLNRQWKKQMTQKEAQFFERIKKHRVDPTNSSASNPVPDFYGEKISSVSGYRQWLKDQKAFNKKKTANFV